MTETPVPPATATPAPVRVRFCPSPTGTPHVGLIRTALFNWAHARHTGGTMVFRVEDTDTQRDSEESYQQLLEALAWLGIDWDEGVETGGPHAPYRQSQRLDVYRDVAARLLEHGAVYEAYSTPEEVEARHRAAGRDPKLGYDNHDRDLTREQVAAYRAEGREPVLRLRMPDEDIVVRDMIRGEIVFKAGSIPDYVVVRANGQPLYTLTNPVDDALMEISHVLRGEDLLSSTPRQIALFQVLVDLGIAQRVPEYGHLPYVMGEGNKKLSKRDPESSLFHLRDSGFVPEGLLNYLALLGWSLSADEDVFTVEQLVAHFDVHDVLANPARFDLKKATAINGTHVRMLEPADFRDRLVPYLQAAGVLGETLTEREAAVLDEAAPLVQERMNLLGEAPELLSFLFADDDGIEVADDARKQLKDSAGDVLRAALGALEPLEDWSAGSLETALREAIVDGLGIKPRLAFGPVRTAVSGRRISPPLFESLEILGKDSSLTRIRSLAPPLGSPPPLRPPPAPPPAVGRAGVVTGAGHPRAAGRGGVAWMQGAMAMDRIEDRITDEQVTALRAGRPQHRNPVQRDTVTWLRTGAETGGEHALLHVEVDPGGEVLAHYHRRIAMRLRVLEGTLRVQVGHVVRDLGPGREAEVPEEHLFRWTNPASAPARFVLELRPASVCYERGLAALYGLARDGRTRRDGRPRSLLRTALLMQWTDIHLPGLYRWLGPLIRVLAAVASRRGTGRELERRYCR